MSKNKYWQSFAELNGGDVAEQMLKEKRRKDEFGEDLPFEDKNGSGWMKEPTPRRDFLKYLGFSTAAATLAASCDMPVRKAIPMVNRPENVTPGVAKYYSTAFVQDGEVVPAVAKVRDGRPIKLEGNEFSTLTNGGTSARMQASVLDLYDTHRIKTPMRRTATDWKAEALSEADKQLGAAMAGLAGAPAVLLTGTVISPSAKAIITEFLAKYPGSRHVQYDAVSHSGMLLANGADFGQRAIPSYAFDRARVIVSIGADFLGSWIAPVEFARQYSKGRKIDERAPRMSRHYQLESHLSMTGASADERYVHAPSQTGAVALALLNALGGGAPAQNLGDAKLQAGLAKIVADLQANRGGSLVVCGSNDPAIQTVVNAINGAIGAYGTTINWGAPNTTKQGLDTEMQTLVADMNAGRVGALLIHDANPSYDYLNAKAFNEGLAKVKLKVSFGSKWDETTDKCGWVIPSHHYLESWGDAESRPGYVAFQQPTINPLFAASRHWLDSLLAWSGNPKPYADYFRTFWEGRLGGQAAFDTALQAGVIEGGKVPAMAAGSSMGMPGKDTTIAHLADTSAIHTANHTTTSTSHSPAGTQQSTTNGAATLPPNGTGNQPATTSGAAFSGGGYNGGGLAAAVAAIAARPKPVAGNTEIVLYQDVKMGSGKQSGNPWLLEVPDPITKSTWDNFAMIGPAKAKELGIELDMDYEYYMDKPLIKITANGVTQELPVLVMPGVHANTVAIAVGYGRHDKYSTASTGAGKNVFPWARFNGTSVDYTNEGKVERGSGKYKVAQTQIHNSYEERFEVVRETTMGTFMKQPHEIKEWRNELHADYAPKYDGSKDSGAYVDPNFPKENGFRKEATLYGDFEKPGLKWGMSIDMNSCIGCQACVVACHTENNVPVVGKSEVLRYHDMHWMRIDRYFVSDAKNPDELKGVVFQPMLCQHCDNAPCENVCPVAATPHSSEGINMMTYNRCIGTRYCANNCPYKVRRFNWADYTGSTSFGKGGAKSGVGVLDPVVAQMNDDLTRMVLNPDVTVRSRGVMEKCTFCVQRTQEAKLKVKLENREFRDGDVKSACQQACPTSAIVFGNVNDRTSAISRMRHDNPNRMFYVIEQVHTLPNVSYLAKVRNTDDLDGHDRFEPAGQGHAAQGKDEKPHTQGEKTAEPH